MNKLSQSKALILIIATTILLVILFIWGSGKSRIVNIKENRFAPIQGSVYIPEIGTIASRPEPGDITILVGGDVMFDRTIRKISEEDGYDSPLYEIKKIFKNADISVINLEGPITSNPSKTILANGTFSKELIFTFSPKSAVAIKEAGITAVSLANNHTDNFGAEGFAETKNHLQTAKVSHFGSPWNTASTSFVISKKQIKVAFVGYHAFQKGFDLVLAEIKSRSQEGAFVIVIPHWGEEYETTASENMRSQAQKMIAAGANAIIGAHPHVIMDHEWINGVPVFYSVGNLLFDQYFSPEVMKGNLVELHLSKDEKIVLDRVRIYETSMQQKRFVEVTAGPMEVK